MSLKDRVVDGVNSLFEKLNDGEAIGSIDPAELEKELAQRVAVRKALGNPPPLGNERARLAAAGEAARGQRAALAKARVTKIHGRRAKKASAQKREQDAAFRTMAEEARRNPPPQPSSSSGRSSAGSARTSSSSRGGRRPSIFQNKDMAQHYKTMGVEYGADAVTVKKSYRALMRKYHPDLHADPKKKKAATKLTVKISAAYEAIEKHHKK